MSDWGKTQNIYRVLICLFFLNMFFCILPTASFAVNKEFLGVYEYTMYVDGYPLKGSCQRYMTGTSESISTYFGSYQDTSIIQRSTLKVEHSYKGYIEIANDKAYYDQNQYLRKTETRWKIHLTGYYQEEYTVTYEYGNYVTLTDTPTVFEETYSVRYYRNGNLYDTISGRDYSTYETEEYISIDSGTYYCIRIRTNFYEDGGYIGSGVIWIDDNDGILIKEQDYDESDNLIMSKTLLSKSIPISGWEIALWILGPIGIILGAYAIYTKNKAKIEEPVTETTNKIKPHLYGSSSTIGTYKPMYREESELRSSTSGYGTNINDLKNYRTQPRISIIPPSQSESRGFNLDCPFCHGTGMLAIPNGLMLCPFCKRQDII